MSSSLKEKSLIAEVKDFVEKERKRMVVKESQIGTDYRKEGSCYSQGQKSGEFKNLLYAQLIYTRYGYGSWNGLNGKVLDGLIEYINNIKRYENKQ